MHICDPSNKKIIALSFTKKSKVVIQVVIHFHVDIFLYDDREFLSWT